MQETPKLRENSLIHTNSTLNAHYLIRQEYQCVGWADSVEVCTLTLKVLSLGWDIGPAINRQSGVSQAGRGINVRRCRLDGP